MVAFKFTAPSHLSCSLWNLRTGEGGGGDGGGSSANSRSLSRPLFELVMHQGDRMEASSDPPPSLPRPGKKRQMLHAVDHTEKGKSDSTRGETVFFSLPILVNCSARTINVIVFNCLRRMSVTFKMVSRDDKSCQASWAWSPPVVESVARSFGYFGKRPSSFLRPCPPEFRRDTAYIIFFHQTSNNGICKESVARETIRNRICNREWIFRIFDRISVTGFTC